MPRRRLTRRAHELPEDLEITRLLALDPSSTCTGYACFDNGHLTAYGKWRPPPKSEHGQKLDDFRRWLLELLEVLQPTEVVFEMPYAGRRRSAYPVLMMYVGVILAVHWSRQGREVPIINRMPASAVKKHLKMPKGASHEARKHMMILEINRLYRLQLRFKDNDATKRISDDDVADAIACGRAWILRHRPSWLADAG